MDCYPPPSQNVVTLPLSSAIFSVLNFLGFDILLASIAFWLTADIAGLVNSASALQQLGNRIQPYNPPLVGVGLTCTRRNVFRVLVLLRGIAMLGVLVTNFLSEGESCSPVRSIKQQVVVPAIIDLNDITHVKLRRLALRRRSCQGRNKTEVYYGELRFEKHCELRPELMTQPTVYFGLDFVNRTIEFPKDGCECYTDEQFYAHMHRFTCKGLGTIGCQISFENLKTIPSSCVGVVMADDWRPEKKGKISYMCEGEALFPGRLGLNRSTNEARCRMARGANITDTSWVPLMNAKARTLRDAIDGVYGAGLKNETVKVVTKDKIERTDLKKGYFWVLGAKLVLILALILVDVAMRGKGLVPAANNEFGLGSLLAQSAANAPQIGDDDRPIVQDATRDESMHLLHVQNNNGVIRAHSVRR